jgi:hypothetical protein
VRRSRVHAIVATMSRVPVSCFLLTAFAAACGSESHQKFVPFDDLCPGIAEDVCTAQQGCCDGDAGATSADAGAASCEQRVTAACDSEREKFESNAALTYDGERASDVRDQQREALAECKPPFTLGRFFEGTKKLGSACKEDSECASGRCDETCVAAAVAPLCQL